MSKKGGTKIYSTLNRKKEYLLELKNGFRKLIFFFLFFSSVFFFYLFFLLYNNAISTLSLSIFFIGISIVLISIIIFSKWFMKAKKSIEKGQVGLRIDRNGIYFGKHFRIEEFKYSEIDFIFIGKDKKGITLLLITKSEPKIQITNELLNDPNKFINKLRELKNDLKIYSDDKFINEKAVITTLKSYSIKLYYGQIGTGIIKEIT